MGYTLGRLGALTEVEGDGRGRREGRETHTHTPEHTEPRYPRWGSDLLLGGTGGGTRGGARGGGGAFTLLGYLHHLLVLAAEEAKLGEKGTEGKCETPS